MGRVRAGSGELPIGNPSRYHTLVAAPGQQKWPPRAARSVTAPPQKNRPESMAANREYSAHQRKIINNYYKNRDAMALQRLGELVTELYLAEGKARATKWKQAAGALEKLGLPQSRIDHILEKSDVTLLAKVLEELMEK